MSELTPLTAQEIANKIDALDPYQRKAFIILLTLNELDDTFLKLPLEVIERIYAKIRDALKEEMTLS